MGRIGLLYAVLAVLLVTAGCGKAPREDGEALRRAAGADDAERVKALIAEGMAPDARDTTGKTALFYAAQSGNMEIAQLLVTHGASIDAQDRWQITPLHAALRRRRTDVARFLVSAGAQVTVQTYDGETPLHAAAQMGDVEIVRLLVIRGAEINATTRTGDTPLLWAAKEGRHEIAKFLIAKGADVNAQGGDDFASPLHVAAEMDHIPLVRLLLDSGARIDPRDRLGRTPAVRAMQRGHRNLVSILIAAGAEVDLHLAAYLGDVTIAKRLIETGTDVNIRDDLDNTPLHYAARSGQAAVADVLIANGAEVDAEDEHGNTPLHLATKHVEVTKVLVDHGADLNARDQGGRTALQEAVSYGTREVVDLLVDRGAEIDLHLAAYIGRLDKVKELVAGGADVNLGHNQLDESIIKGLSAVYPEAAEEKSTHRADTPLHRAVQGGHADVVDCLLSAGADLEAQDVEGRTALHEAAYLGFTEIAKTLIAHGANVNAVAGTSWRYGDTPLQMAAHGGHTATVALLVAHGADVSARDAEDRSALFHAWTKGFADVIAALGGDVNDLAPAERQPYRVIIRNPEAIRKVLLPDECEATWIPEPADIEGLDLVLRSYLIENTAIATGTSVEREALLASLRRYNQEYGGFISNGTKCIVCNMVMTEHPEAPNKEEFTWWSVGCEDMARVIFDAEKRTVIRIDDPTFYVFY